MSTTVDTLMISQPVPKESDVDAPVRFPKKETEVARKADKVGCVAFMRENKCGATGLTVGCINIPVGGAVAYGGAEIGYLCGGMTGSAVGATLVGTAAIGVTLGALACTFADPDVRAVWCGCCKSKVKEKPELEEIVTEQPKAKSPSPEPEPAKGGWFSLSTWFAKPSGAKEPVDESSV
ncbi:MAG: hypothetical protein OXF02_01230 [Simkaniaceae bacterium]|nr:hypothetical protein [Simkaniaceae bacterium]